MITTVITGSLNAIAYSILSDLHLRNFNVLVLDQAIHPSFDINRARQDVTDKLKKNFKHQIFENSNIVNWFKTKQSSASISTLIYNCHVSLHDEILTKTMGIHHYTQLIYNFVDFLDYISSADFDSNNLQIVLIITIVDNPIQQASLELFIMILYSYQSNYDLNISIAFIKEDFSEERCSNFNDLLDFIRGKSNDTGVNRVFQCVDHQIQSTDAASSGVTKTNILFSTYFTNNKQFVRPYRENSFQFVKGFVVTAKQHNARIVLYYDRMDPKYKESLLEYYSNIEFIHYRGDFHHRTINDARFYILYDYLLAHPEIERIILQDLRDGIFFTDPFKVMELAGDYLFVGMDVSFHLNMNKNYKHCERKMNHIENASTRYYPMLNAGSMGGTRHVVLAFLKQMVKAFDDIFPSRLNCNMDAFDFVTHYYFKDLMFSGYPFQGFMQLKLASPRGIAIRHKRTKFDM